MSSRRCLYYWTSLWLYFCVNSSDTTGCEYFSEIRERIKNVTFGAAFDSAKYNTGAPATDRAVSLTGLVFASCVFIGCFVVFFLGLAWRVAFGRIVWPLLLLGVAIIAILRILGWVQVCLCVVGIVGVTSIKDIWSRGYRGRECITFFNSSPIGFSVNFCAANIFPDHLAGTGTLCAGHTREQVCDLGCVFCHCCSCSYFRNRCSHDLHICQRRCTNATCLLSWTHAWFSYAKCDSSDNGRFPPAWVFLQVADCVSAAVSRWSLLRCIKFARYLLSCALEEVWKQCSATNWAYTISSFAFEYCDVRSLCGLFCG